MAELLTALLQTCEAIVFKRPHHVLPESAGLVIMLIQG